MGKNTEGGFIFIRSDITVCIIRLFLAFILRGCGVTPLSIIARFARLSMN